jgi:tRNA A37 threonylcarbamoyladenosine dehydratase
LGKLKNADVLVKGLGGAGAMPYMPAAFEIACASVVIRDLT